MKHFHFLYSILFYISIYIQKKDLLFLNGLDNRNYINKNNNQIPITVPMPLILKENILSKNSFILNEGTDHKNNIDDENSYQNELNKIQQNFKKKKILDFLLDNTTCSFKKLELIEKYSFLFEEEKGLKIKKDFQEFLSS